MFIFFRTTLVIFLTTYAALMLGSVVTDRLIAAGFAIEWMPLAIFVCAAGISFATGTSWGTMGILCPVAVTIVAGLAVDVAPDRALTLFYASVGSVLAGAIFGDHCSPISDTTIMSSMSCASDHIDHVKTQIPYALTVAATAVFIGFLPAACKVSPFISIFLGIGIIFVVVRFLGKKVD